MRDVILFIAASLDGYIARPGGEIDWLFSDADYNYTPFFADVDTVVMGRLTYELSLTFGPDVYQGRSIHVLSRTRNGTSGNVTFVAGGLPGLIANLRSLPGKNIWIVGGAEVVRDAVASDLIDRYVLSYHPILLGEGIPLFPPSFPELRLKLVGAETFPSGLVQLTYIKAPR